MVLGGALFKDPCIRLANEVSKALTELANSIRNHRHFSPEILSDHLHEALHDLNKAIKSQPCLFLGSNHSQSKNILTIAAAHALQNQRESNGVSLSSVKTDSSALREWKSKSVNAGERNKVLRPQLSKIAITSLEFSEAVARLDNVIEEVEELGRIACFKEFKAGDDEIVVSVNRVHVQNHLSSADA